MRRVALALAAMALTSTLASPAAATTFRRPFDPDISLGYGFDNLAGAGCQDYACGSKCYDGHKGSDFPLPLATDVRAGADGTVEVVSDGCDSVGFYGSTCGGGYGNYVRVGHADGKQTYYAHLKLGSIAVAQGQAIKCGDKIGESASSGNSTGYHLHFEVRVGGAADDPFSGMCGGPLSYWVAQGDYTGAPATECELACVCTPGETQSETCGNCGGRERSCGDDCQWSDFGACGGEGECAPEESETLPCGDCGEQTRTCSTECSWSEPSACSGPDPNEGNESCDTGRPDACGDGRLRCLEGELSCVPLDESCAPEAGGESREVDDAPPASAHDGGGLVGVVCSARPGRAHGHGWWAALVLAALSWRRRFRYAADP